MESVKREAVVEVLVHKTRAKKNYRALKLSTEQCQTREILGVLAFHFMQNLHLPNIPVQDLFYLSQLTVNVFCIHDLKSNKSAFNSS